MKKRILIAEDNFMVSKVLEKTLSDYSFEVVAVSNGLEALEELKKSKFDLLLTDIEMPEMNGLELIKTLKENHIFDEPILVISADEKDQSVITALTLGAEDYIVKPLNTQVLILRVQKALNIKQIDTKTVDIQHSIINKKMVGIVIPCYNEEERLRGEEFKSFVSQNSSYHICFVNDGSKDNTLHVLNELKKGNEDFISVFNCPKNGGKSEAVRQGILYLLKNYPFEYLGFLDADLSTDFNDYELLISSISTNQYVAVVGSRIQRVGAEINKESSRALISKIINKIIQSIIKMPFRDTQCGAKIFTRDISKKVFSKPFLSRWLFDVEIFIRLRTYLGINMASEKIIEVPLSRWIHMDGSKLSFKDSLKIFSELFRIKIYYRN